MDLPALDPQRAQAVGDHHAGFDGGAGRDDGGPVAVAEAPFGGELRAHLAEHLRLQLGEVAHEAAHASGGVVLGEAVGGQPVGEDGASRFPGGRVVGGDLRRKDRRTAEDQQADGPKCPERIAANQAHQAKGAATLRFGRYIRSRTRQAMTAAVAMCWCRSRTHSPARHPL